MENDVNLLSLHTSSEALLASCHILPLLLPIGPQGNAHLPPATYRKHLLKDSDAQVVHPRVVLVLLLCIRFWLPFTSFPSSFRSCLKETRIYPPTTYRKHLLKDSGAQVVRPRVVLVLHLWIRFWLPVTSFPFCSLHPHQLPKRHMMSYSCLSFISFCIPHSCLLLID